MSKEKIEISGRAWTGFIGECKTLDICPYYLIHDKDDNGIFICELLKKFMGKDVKITIEEI